MVSAFDEAFPNVALMDVIGGYVSYCVGINYERALPLFSYEVLSLVSKPAPAI
jgi:hypothetical protein